AERDVERARDQAADVDLRPGAEHQAVRIDQEDLAVGVERAQDLARALVEDSIERDGRARRLVEVDALARSDVERLPVDAEPLAALRDHGGGSRLRDRAGAGHDLTALRACDGGAYA